jgi:hypothetical protein
MKWLLDFHDVPCQGWFIVLMLLWAASSVIDDISWIIRTMS